MDLDVIVTVVVQRTPGFKPSIVTDVPIVFHTNFGTLLLDNYHATLIDLKNNQIKTWSDIHLGDMYLSGLGKFKPLLNKDSTIYFFNNNYKDSIIIPISKMTFVGKAYKLCSTINYQKFKNLLSANKIWFLIGILVGILFIITLTYFKKIIKAKQVSNQKIETDKPLVQFSIIEIEILKLLYNHIHQTEKVKVDDINAILGVTKKSTEVQRKQRSQTIAAINIKAREMFNINEDLIVRIKNESDSRIVVYTIHKSYNEHIKQIVSEK